ncbi:hypothetical protein Lal_00039880 [Lupinus albus]|nr:hypothetical protein Lal_00039880 [Lupinus albus]
MDPLHDQPSPNFVHPSENHIAPLVSSLLNGENYHNWSGSMRMSLISKQKLSFVVCVCVRVRVCPTNLPTTRGEQVNSLRAGSIEEHTNTNTYDEQIQQNGKNNVYGLIQHEYHGLVDILQQSNSKVITPVHPDNIVNARMHHHIGEIENKACIIILQRDDKDKTRLKQG